MRVCVTVCVRACVCMCVCVCVCKKDKIFDLLCEHSMPISCTTWFDKVRDGWSTLALWEGLGMYVGGAGWVLEVVWVGVRGVRVGGRC